MPTSIILDGSETSATETPSSYQEVTIKLPLVFLIKWVLWGREFWFSKTGGRKLCNNFISEVFATE